MLQMLRGQRIIHLHGSNARSKYAPTLVDSLVRLGVFVPTPVCSTASWNDRRVLTFYPMELLRPTQTPLFLLLHRTMRELG